LSAVAKILFLTSRKILMQYKIYFTAENSMKGLEGSRSIVKDGSRFCGDWSLYNFGGPL